MKKVKSENIVLNDVQISQKMKNKKHFCIEKDIMKREEITVKSLSKVSVSSYKSKNVTVLEWTRFQFITIRVAENAVIIGEPDTFERK